MNKKLLCAVLLMLVSVAIVCHARQVPQPPPDNDLHPPSGRKRSFKVDFSISNWKKMNPNKKID